MFRRICFAGAVAAVSLLSAFQLRAQEHPIAWRLTDSSARTVRPGGTIRLTVAATIPPRWHVYSLLQPPGGPIAMSFAAEPATLFTIGNDISAPVPISAPDPNFSITSVWHEDSATFGVPVVTSAAAHGTQKLAARIIYQTCNDHYCLPPAEDTLTLAVTFAGAPIAATPVVALTPAAPAATPPAPIAQPADTAAANAAFDAGTLSGRTSSLWLYLWTAFTMGALALLTPCVFPMVPITISYFSQRARSGVISDAALYAIGIVGAFTALGLGGSLLFGVAGLNRFAASAGLNLAIAALFIAFALSLFGVFQLAVPARLLNTLDNAARSGGGRRGTTLLMGGTFALTTFTCTAPFVGTLLVSAASGDWRWPAAGLFAFASAFALPFFVLALVPNAAAKLPRSGAWLQTIKATLAFVEIAAALKFLSNADLVQGWGMFTRPVVIGAWIALGAMLALYLAGVRASAPWLRARELRHPLGAALTLAVIAWLATGLGGRRLGELEPFLPPAGLTGVSDGELDWMMNDLDAALVRATAEHKLVLIDFTGYTCTNCRWMEANMFPRTAVQRELDRYVRVRLFTDGAGERYRKQQRFERDRFKTVALPLYAVLDARGLPRATFLGMTRDAGEFVKFLTDAQSARVGAAP